MTRTSIRAWAAGGIGIALLVALVLAAAPAFAQAPSQAEDPHAHCKEAAASTGSTEGGLRPMAAQPQLVPVRLVDQNGRETTLEAALETDGPVMVNFIFTTCTTICPIMTTGFSRFHEALGRDRDRVRLVSISIDPDNDTVAALRAYADRYHAGTSWRMLTGTREASIAAQRAFGAYRGDKMNHTPATYVRRGPGEPWQVIEGLSGAETLQRAWRGFAGTH